MNIEALVSESFTYAREALAGKWTRWAIFILLALPFSLIQFVFDPTTVQAGTEMNRDTVPWGQIAVLFGIGLLLSFFLSGYGVRIYRGVNRPPTSPVGQTCLSMGSSSRSYGFSGYCLSSSCWLQEHSSR